MFTWRGGVLGLPPGAGGAGAGAMTPVSAVRTVFPGSGLSPLQLSGSWSWVGTLWLFRNDGSLVVLDPRRLDFGFITEDLTVPMLIWNGYGTPQTYSFLGVTGGAEGLTVTAPDSATLPPRAEQDFSLEVEADGGPVIQARVCFHFSPLLCFEVVGERVLPIMLLPDWEHRNPRISWAYPSSIFTSDHRYEQRTTTLQEGEALHEITVSYRDKGDDGMSHLWRALQRLGHRRAAIPWFTEQLAVTVDVAGQTVFTVANLPLESLTYTSDYIARIDITRPGWFELRKVTAIDVENQQIHTEGVWTEEVIPSLQRFVFVAFAIPTAKRELDSDRHQTIAVSWEGTPA